MHLRYSYRVYPTRPQRQALARTFGCVRVVYNDAVAAWKAAHRQGLDGLKVRHWACGCGAVHDRDANAEINIRREGRRLVAAGQADT
ncbi:helix-turn-helix domain-containing protein [Glycomyces halotolerans]